MSGYAVAGSVIRAVRTCCTSKPGLTECSAMRLRTSNTPPTRSIREKATSPTTSSLRKRARPNPVVALRETSLCRVASASGLAASSSSIAAACLGVGNHGGQTSALTTADEFDCLAARLGISTAVEIQRSVAPKHASNARPNLPIGFSRSPVRISRMRRIRSTTTGPLIAAECQIKRLLRSSNRAALSRSRRA